jgi:hypothetical protein
MQSERLRHSRLCSRCRQIQCRIQSQSKCNLKFNLANLKCNLTNLKFNITNLKCNTTNLKFNLANLCLCRPTKAFNKCLMCNLICNLMRNLVFNHPFRCINPRTLNTLQPHAVVQPQAMLPHTMVATGVMSVKPEPPMSQSFDARSTTMRAAAPVDSIVARQRVPIDDISDDVFAAIADDSRQFSQPGPPQFVPAFVAATSLVVTRK